MLGSLVCFTILMGVMLSTAAQDYGNYARAAQLQKKAKANTRGGGVIPYVGCFAVGGCVAYMYQQYRINQAHKDIETLQTTLRIHDEINNQAIQQWKSDYQTLYKLYDELEKETVERDYEEFKAPDSDNDDVITKNEFNSYVRKYLASFPELSDQDFPKFDEFDLTSDGKVTFDEWQQFLLIQKLKDENKQKSATDGSKGSIDYGSLLNLLYDQNSLSDTGAQKQLDSGGSDNSHLSQLQTKKRR